MLWSKILEHVFLDKIKYCPPVKWKQKTNIKYKILRTGNYVSYEVMIHKEKTKLCSSNDGTIIVQLMSNVDF